MDKSKRLKLSNWNGNTDTLVCIKVSDFPPGCKASGIKLEI